MTFAELQSKIAKHAWDDPAFEAEFMANPKATFEKYTGQELPAELRIQAHYNTPEELHFVIPARAASGSELSDEDLERVSGGEVTALVIYATIMVTISVSAGVATATTQEDW